MQEPIANTGTPSELKSVVFSFVFFFGGGRLIFYFREEGCLIFYFLEVVALFV